MSRARSLLLVFSVLRVERAQLILALELLLQVAESFFALVLHREKISEASPSDPIVQTNLGILGNSKLLFSSTRTELRHPSNKRSVVGGHTLDRNRVNYGEVRSRRTGRDDFPRGCPGELWGQMKLVDHLETRLNRVRGAFNPSPRSL